MVLKTRTQAAVENSCWTGINRNESSSPCLCIGGGWSRRHDISGHRATTGMVEAVATSDDHAEETTSLGHTAGMSGKRFREVIGDGGGGHPAAGGRVKASYALRVVRFHRYLPARIPPRSATPGPTSQTAEGKDARDSCCKVPVRGSSRSGNAGWATAADRRVWTAPAVRARHAGMTLAQTLIDPERPRKPWLER